MLADQVHLLIQSLYACHIGFCIIGQFDLLATAHTLGAPVEIAHIDRAADLACYSMEACLPSLYRLAGAFRREGKMHDFLCLHLFDDAEGNIASFLPVNRNASELS